MLVIRSLDFIYLKIPAIRFKTKFRFGNAQKKRGHFIDFLLLTIFIMFDDNAGCVAVGLYNSSIIPHSSFTASSFFPNYPPYNARLNSSFNGWTPTIPSDTSPYLEVDLGAIFHICAVATQGDLISSREEWTTEYKLQFSLDGSVWHYYRTENGVVKV